MRKQMNTYYKVIVDGLFHSIVAVLFLIFVPAQIVAQNKPLKAYLNDKFFYAPDIGSYLEIHIHIEGSTVQSKKISHEAYQGQVLITQTILNYTEVIHHHQAVINSPVSETMEIADFVDLFRFDLPEGAYTYQLTLEDLHSKLPPLTVEKKILQPDISNQLALSDIVTALQISIDSSASSGPLYKSGYHILPMATNYYPQQLGYLPYYVEIYQNDPSYLDDVYVVQERILTKKEQTELAQFTRYFRYPTAPFKGIAKSINLEQLPSGEYLLELSIIDRRKNTITAKTIPFTRANRAFLAQQDFSHAAQSFDIALSTDSAHYYVSSLIPICGPIETKNIIKLLKEKNNEKNLRYLENFWVITHPENPMEAWLKYKEQVDEVHRLFATNFQMGHETDRGRVYLQYGEPNQISSVPSSPSEYPYEIWQYDKIERFSNRRFVFYSPTNLNNDYRLLHSDMLGEIQNRRWQFALNKRNTYDDDLDDPRGTGHQNHWGGNSSLYYNSY